nr:hypothetical protein GCM10020185_21240 [Pseudomonas brassicacearum subsp. brassicacearum]
MSLCRKKDMHFDRDEQTLDKAIWLIQIDALEALIDALKLTEEKRHRIASRLFRDAVETMDISAYFYLAGDGARKKISRSGITTKSFHIGCLENS